MKSYVSERWWPDELPLECLRCHFDFLGESSAKWTLLRAVSSLGLGLVSEKWRNKDSIQRRNRDNRLSIHFGGGPGQLSLEFSPSVPTQGTWGRSCGEQLQRGWVGVQSRCTLSLRSFQSVSLCLHLCLQWGLWSPKFWLLFLLS